jgi:uncharacterized cupin superfamily protein
MAINTHKSTHNSTHIVPFSACDTPTERSLPSAEKIISGHPLQTLLNHYTSADGTFFSGEWHCDIGAWTVNYGPSEQEFCQLIEGHVVLTHADGTQFELKAGDRFIVPAGFQGVWECKAFTRKTYVIYDPNASPTAS